MDGKRLQEQRQRRGLRRPWAGATVAAAGALLLGGCLQTAPVVVVTPEEQQARVVYNCPNAKSFVVTRLASGKSALVVVDGNTLRLDRDASNRSAERYTNRLQTLTIYGGSATLDHLGRTQYGPCTGGEYAEPNTAPGRRNREDYAD